MAEPIDRPVRFGLIGAGVIARSAHALPFKARPDRVQMAVICDGEQANAGSMAEDIGGDIAIVSEPQALLDRDDVEAVIVATPHNSHAALAEACVAAGKPVLVEKPVVCSLDEMRRLRRAARAAGVPVIAGQMRRFEPEVLWLRDWVRADSANFGQLRSFDIQSWQNLEGYLYRSGAGHKHWLLDGARAGGGVVISLAIHQLDLVRFLFDTDFVSVTAHGRFDEPFYNGAESSATATLSTSNGAAGVLHANYLAPRVPFCEALSAFGTSGAIIQHVEKHGDYRGPFRYATTGGTPTTDWAEQFTGFRKVPPPAGGLDPSSFVNQTVAFADFVRGGAAPPNSLDQNFNTIATIEAIVRSICTGQTVQVETL